MKCFNCLEEIPGTEKIDIAGGRNFCSYKCYGEAQNAGTIPKSTHFFEENDGTKKLRSA